MSKVQSEAIISIDALTKRFAAASAKMQRLQSLKASDAEDVYWLKQKDIETFGSLIADFNEASRQIRILRTLLVAIGPDVEAAEALPAPAAKSLSKPEEPRPAAGAKGTMRSKAPSESSVGTTTKKAAPKGASPGKKRVVVKAPQAPAVLYRDRDSKNTWSGVGKVPNWVKAKEQSGIPRKEFLVRVSPDK